MVERVLSAASAAYDVVMGAEEPCVHWSGWILGQKYSLPNDEDKIAERIRSCLWFSYRKNFRPIGSTGYTSDSGWGCTMRCGQMLLAEALSRLHLPADFRWRENHDNIQYRFLLQQFLEVPGSLYSLQQIAQMGVDQGRNVGDWFGPNTMCQVVKSLSSYDNWSNIAVHIAMDLTIVEEEVRASATASGKEARPGAAGKSTSPAPDVSLCGRSVADGGLSVQEAQASAAAAISFRPVLLLVPLRLGLDKFEGRYTQPLLACFSLPQSVGIIGGKPRHALWFIGHRDGKLVYLDPHTTQASLQYSEVANFSDSTYHTSSAGKMKPSELDPSVALGFFCKTREELDDLFLRLRQDVASVGPSMFELHEQRPSSLQCLLLDGSGFEDDDFVASSGQPAPTDSSTGVEDLHSRSRRGSGNEAEYDDYDIIDDMEVPHVVAAEAAAESELTVSKRSIQERELYSLLA
ncbi:cysteine protease ATG4B-like [Sycon ciliatum]|uniref:cysteine protease ATG4B-like n=1 Tax=Sycon ciliatum TaxID=27933 RepID=UPI0031F6C80B